MWFMISIFSLVISSVACRNIPKPMVNILQGTVEGSIDEDGSYYEFYGIPYASPVSGVHRFQAASPPLPFQDKFVADRENIKCVHALGGLEYGGMEDCLVANVFTPSLDSNGFLPVMVWINGRQLDTGYGHETPITNFMEKRVVIVTLTYRESIFGFLCLGTESAPGNAGLRDIIAGLQWIQTNIAQFGGDPDNVSILGHGIGAAAVDLITMSPMANGLVHKAITQGGNTFAPRVISNDNLEYSIKVAELLGHSFTNIDDLIKILTKTSIKSLMAAINELGFTNITFAPCMGNKSLKPSERFFDTSPYKTMINKDFLKIPFMMGFVESDVTISAIEISEENEPKIRHNNYEKSQKTQQIKLFSFGNELVNHLNTDGYDSNYRRIMTSVVTLREALIRSQTSESIYLFSYKSFSRAPFANHLENIGTGLSEEGAYLLYDAPDTPVSELDFTEDDILVERWTNFAKTGSPTSEMSPIEWQPLTLNNPVYLRIVDDDEAEITLNIQLVNPQPAEVSLWDDKKDDFLEVVTRKQLTERNEDEDENTNNIVVVEYFDEGSGDEPEFPEIPEEPDETEPETDDVDEDPDTDSASTAVGYNFFIITFFSILSLFRGTLVLV